MYTFLIILHVIVAILLVVVILMQSSKGGGLAGAFGGAGGGGSQALFGGRGAASFLQKLTVGLAVVFMLLALVINLVGDQSATQQSVVKEAAQQQELTPGTPLPKPSGTEEGSQGLAPVETPGSQGTPIPQQNPENEGSN
ncbi:MAG: Protein-export membrane protein SecG [Candidatus Marinimicrobia bacterium]|nr:Protein-export membrane protein SecG [Candidatus Neomarinimicrobiota bacterium]